MAGNDSFTKVLLHFDGSDTSTTITDDNAGGSAHTWTANGNAQLDTGITKFGTATLLCDGTGDYVSTPDHADFTLGSSNFVADVWFNRAGGDGTRRFLFGQADNTGSSLSITAELNASNVVVATYSKDGSATVSLTGSTAITATGWHHFAFLRSGNNLYLALDGAIEAGPTAISGGSGSIFDSSNAFAVGRRGELTTLTWNGSLDEFRLSVGTDRGWTSTFTPPTAAYSTTSIPVMMHSYRMRRAA